RLYAASWPVSKRRSVASSVAETGAAADFREGQRDGKRRQFDAIAERLQALFGECLCAREDDHIHCVLRNDDIMGERRQLGIGRTLPAKIDVLRRGRETSNVTRTSLLSRPSGSGDGPLRGSTSSCGSGRFRSDTRTPRPGRITQEASSCCSRVPSAIMRFLTINW